MRRSTSLPILFHRFRLRHSSSLCPSPSPPPSSVAVAAASSTISAAAIAAAAASSLVQVHGRPFSTLNHTDLNPKVRRAEYAVRGELVQKAEAIAAQITSKEKAEEDVEKRTPSAYPFDRIIHCNIGNPQALDQAPLTFPRQVLSLCQYPPLLSHKNVAELFSADAIDRAKKYLSELPGGMGAYTQSAGIRKVREEVAAFIKKRDGYDSSPDDIYLTAGASTAVNYVLNLLISSSSDTVMTPIPQYPLYSATLALLGAPAAGYYLDESTGWSLSESELHSSLERSKKQGHRVKGLVVINPGNPTGQCLPYDVMSSVVRFCEKNGLVLMADEVYQANIYGKTPFTSFKRVIRDLKSKIPLFSFHSTSKGFLGECGQRGGYVECTNVSREVHSELLKLASIGLCSNTSGQIMMGLMVNPPSEGQDSYSQYQQEKKQILDSLKRRAIRVAKVLNECEGISCQNVEGAMYAFPRITLPTKAVEAAKKAGKVPDVFYCLCLLDSTGLVVVPGSGFGQREGEWHFRMTILPKEEELDQVMEGFKTFHQQFMRKYHQ